MVPPDRPGFGRSSFVPGRRLADWPRDLVALADHLALARLHVIGVSGGAPYAMASGQQLGDRISRLALVCGLGEFVGDDSTSGMNAAAATAINFHRHWPRVGHWAYMRLIGPLLRRYPTLVFKILIGSEQPDGGEVNVGDTVTYTVIVTNNGPDSATNVALTDWLPAGVTYVSDTATQGSYNDGTGVWTVGTIANGASEDRKSVV